MTGSAPEPSTAPWGAFGVTVRFDGTVALDDVSMAATRGTVTAVVGGDGAGKTTLLRCLAGVLAPHSGSVRRPAQQGTGYFPASTGTYPDLTVAENLAFRAAAYNLRGPDVAARTADLIGIAGLAAAKDRPAGELSGGMRRKLGVIAAMLHRPELLVLDEPSTGVDPVSRAGLWWLITRAAADGAAVVLATTYLDDAQRAGAVLVLDAGRRLAAGTPEEIVAAMPGTVRTLTGEPAGTAARRAWRRNGGWREWVPPQPDAARAGKIVEPDLQDAVMVAALARAADEPDPPAGAAEPAGVARAAPGVLVQCTAVTCNFGRFTAVRDVSLEVRPGEIVGLLGANGAGKTTLIRMLLGLQRASSGRIVLLGEAPSRGTRSRIGYVPQGLGLYDDLTAAENMAFATAAFGRQTAALPADVVRLGRVPAGLLPLGAQRRLAFAQALAHEPDLLILDEPTSGVDPLGRARLWDTIARAAADGAGVLVSTHYMEEAGECDRLLMMAAAEVVAAGTVTEILGATSVTVVQTDEWAAAFGRLSAAGLPATLAGRTLRVRAPEQDVAAVLRPGGTGTASLSRAPATLEEFFFGLAARAGEETVSA